MTDPSRRTDRTLLLVILAVLGVLVAVAILVVALRPAPVRFAEGTPERVVQQYAEAVLAGDEQEAAGLLSSELREECTAFTAPPTDGIRVVHLSTTERESSADVRVSMTVFYGDGPFGPDEATTEEVFDLVEEDGEWRIASAPWQLAICPERVP